MFLSFFQSLVGLLFIDETKVEMSYLCILMTSSTFSTNLA